MSTLWFVLVAATFAAYVVLDGYDLGAGILHPFVAKTDDERRAVIGAVAPVWDGNEVFLVAGGATLYLAFPRLFAVFTSGFYLPIMMVLWLLALRGLGIEMRHKFHHPIWDQLWDGGFFLGSALLVVFFGAALGNVVRGVSLDEHGEFFAPLWTNGRVGNEVGILDWYTLLVGVTALLAVAHHGALWLATHGSADATAPATAVANRARALARILLPAAITSAAISSATSFAVQPAIMKHVSERPWGTVFVVIAAAGAAAAFYEARVGRMGRAFLGSCVFLVGLFSCACFGMFPYGLPARMAEHGILAADAAADPYALQVGLAWWLPGMALVATWFWLARRLRTGVGKQII